MLNKLQHDLEYAENIIEAVREPLLVLDPNLKILTANQSFYNNFKVLSEDTIGNFIYDLGNRQWDIPKLRTLLEEILPQKNVFNDYEVEHDFLNIGHRVIRLNARQIFRGDVGSHIILLAMEDITERKRLAAEIQDAREYAENIVETVSEPLVVLNSALKILTANHSFYDTFKVTPEETVGNFIYDLGNRQWDIPKLRVLFEEILPHDSVLNGYEVEHNFPEIGRKIMLLNARQISREDIGSHIILLAMEDITERRRIENALADQKREVEEINKSLEIRVAKAVDELRQKDNMMLLQYRQALMGGMISNIAHQWRQPLNSLGLVVQQFPLFYKFGELNEDFLKENTAKAMDLIKFMSQTIDDFRNFFKTDKKSVTFKVNEVIARTLSLFEESLKDMKIGVVFNPEDEPVANGYPHEYAQVLMNILVNAQDALVQNKVEDAQIAIHTFSEGGRSVVTITDNAGGVPNGIINKVFDPYFTTKGPDKGMGVGLYMAKTIIEGNMVGRLNVRNIGSGAEFRIEV